MLATPTKPREPIEASLMSAKDLRKLKASTKTTFEGNYSLDVPAAERIEKIFGGRIRGDTRRSSSRLTRGEPRKIAGITVPDKPPEPDNCCMSGCINCVWEMYRDDIKEWTAKRHEAAAKLNEQGGDFIWPKDFYPPLRYLNEKHVPAELKEEKHKREQESKAPEKAKKAEEDASWENVPVAIRVFAEAEKKIKARRVEKASQL